MIFFLTCYCCNSKSSQLFLFMLSNNIFRSISHVVDNMSREILSYTTEYICVLGFLHLLSLLLFISIAQLVPIVHIKSSLQALAACCCQCFHFPFKFSRVWLLFWLSIELLSRHSVFDMKVRWVAFSHCITHFIWHQRSVIFFFSVSQNLFQKAGFLDFLFCQYNLVLDVSGLPIYPLILPQCTLIYIPLPSLKPLVHFHHASGIGVFTYMPNVSRNVCIPVVGADYACPDYLPDCTV